MDKDQFNNKTYKAKYICFDCRKVFKRKQLSDIFRLSSDNSNVIEKTPKCPDCGNITSFVGAKFRPPIKDDKQTWEILKIISDVSPEGHSEKYFGHLYTWNDQLDLPSGKLAMKKHLIEYKTYLEQMINKWVKADYSEDNKHTIKFFSDKLKILQAFFSK